MADFLDTRHGRRIAYDRVGGAGPGVVFMCGFRSDMEGDKALHLREWAVSAGRSFLRFDYSGHGLSGGDFLDGCIGDWAEDALDVVCALTEGPQVLVGSSMGGWISLLVARSAPERVRGLVGIAAAPDFTEDSMWAGFSEERRARLLADGRVELPSEYSDEPYVITRRLVEDGRLRLVLREPLEFRFPVRLLQGSEDHAVSRATALRLFDHLDCPDIRLSFVKGADHRFSTPECLSLILSCVEEVGR